MSKTGMRKYKPILAIVIALAQFLSACGSVQQPEEFGITDQFSQTTIPEPRTSPTPIPNKRAEAVLDDSFSRYLIRALESKPLISVDELTELYSQGELFLVDLRNPLTIKREGYIPGAVSIPLRELGQKTSLLPDFTVPIITYCEEEWQCVIAQAGLGVYGWDIRILKGGLTQWLESGGTLEQGQILVPEVDPLKPAFPCCGIYEVSAEAEDTSQLSADAPDAALVAAIDRMFDKIPAHHGGITPNELMLELEQSSDLMVIDLRSNSIAATEGEINALNKLQIPLEKMMESRDQWPSNPDTDIVVYSQDSKESVIAMTIFWTYGYRNVRSLVGGFAAWSEIQNQ